MDIIVKLNQERRTYKGRTYSYWYLRWFASDGRHLGQSLGRVDKISKRPVSPTGTLEPGPPTLRPVGSCPRNAPDKIARAAVRGHAIAPARWSRVQVPPSHGHSAAPSRRAVGLT